jgi:hypothetical protein
MPLSQLTTLYNALTDRDVAKLKCSKGEAVAKVLKAQLAKQETDGVLDEVKLTELSDALEEPLGEIFEQGVEVEVDASALDETKLVAVNLVAPADAVELIDAVADENISPITGRPKKRRGVVVNRQAGVPARILQALQELSDGTTNFFGINVISEKAGTKTNTTANYLSNFVAGRMSLPEGVVLKHRRGEGRFVEWRVGEVQEVAQEETAAA